MQADDVERVVRTVVDPYLERPLDSSVRAVTVRGDRAEIELVLGFPVGGYEPELTTRITQALSKAGVTGSIKLNLRAEITAHAVQKGLQPLAGIKNVLAIASGKGGVGKSTVSANLALALAHQGATVGLLDADIYGPSQPLMMGLTGQRPVSRDGKKIEPLSAYGVAVMSIGFLIDATQPMVWRGPMVSQALAQLLSETQWGERDYLIVDMPPGTGAIIVTTPQDIALLDARKGLEMFRKVEVPVLGLVENMSTHVCSQCGHEEPIFGAGGGARMAEEYRVPLLGSLPLDIRIREQADGGRPTVAADPDGPLAARYLEIARRAAARLATQDAGPAFPTLSVTDD
jgi:ATP-binding protein involved in chromosome partitioning